MPVTKLEDFSFGGVDSRSNPANYPVDRALRCLNFAPQEDGDIRLRSGYSVPLNASNDTIGATSIHTLIYYEQFSASFVGPQYVLYGKGSAIIDSPIAGGGTEIGAFTTTNPWGHFRSNNRLFISDGTTQYNWDGTTLRVSGIPPAASLQTSVSAYAGSAVDAGGAHAWSNPTNAQGPPDGNFASCSLPTGFGILTNPLVLTQYGFSVPTATPIYGCQVVLVLKCSDGGLPPSGAMNMSVLLTEGGVTIGNVKQFRVNANQTAVSVALGSMTDGWGANLTATIVSASTFGVQVTGNGASSGSSTWFVDSVQIILTYTLGAAVQVSVQTSAQGSVATTALTGYQFYMAMYDPVTQHMGNRVAIGFPVTVPTNASSAFVITGLPTPTNPEWVLALGITNDGGTIPYWCIDFQGNPITVPNGNATAVLLTNLSQPLDELPVLNDPPQPMDKFARVGNRIWGHLSGNPFLQYSNDEADVSNANYVGRPEESWPGDQQVPLPTGEMPTAIHGRNLEGWFFSLNNLCIFSPFLLLQGAYPWRGPWPGGCVGQRAFVDTPYGPFWLSNDKQLCTFIEDGVLSVSEEYEASLLAKLAHATLGQVELSYVSDPTQLVEKIVIKGLDGNGNVVYVSHDLRIKDQRSPFGQGYASTFTGLNITTFAGAGFTPRQPVRDTAGKFRLWAGSSTGFIAQLEDGSTSDNGANYTGDYIGLIGLGPNRPIVAEAEWQGDGNVTVSWTQFYNSTAVSTFTPAITEPMSAMSEKNSTRYKAKIGVEGRWLFVRFQLTSHPADGNFALTDPPNLPIPTYGVINEITLSKGRDRPEGR